MKERIEQWVVDNEGSIHSMFEHLHMNPEVKWKEFETSAYIRRQLDECGLSYRTFEEHTGIVAEWKGKMCSTPRHVGLRADLDALWQHTKDGWQAVHSCGHDAHMTMVFHAVKCLREIGFVPEGVLKVIFQPAEEGGGGARTLCSHGVIDDLDTLLGIHLRPIQEMPNGHASPAIYHGCSGKMEAIVTGKASHSARPHLGINAADVLLAIGLAVNSVRPDPSIPASAKITVMQTEGTSRNIIPEGGYCCIDLRAQTNEQMQELITKVTRAIEGAGHSFGATVKANLLSCGSAAKPDAWMEQVVSGAIESLGSSVLHPPPISPGAEDFHGYRVHKPSLRASMVGLGCDLKPGLHDPEMTFNRDALKRGIEILALSTMGMFQTPLPIED